jgi:hypothetical protein
MRELNKNEAESVTGGMTGPANQQSPFQRSYWLKGIALPGPDNHLFTFSEDGDCRPIDSSEEPMASKWPGSE